MVLVGVGPRIPWCPTWMALIVEGEVVQQRLVFMGVPLPANSSSSSWWLALAGVGAGIGIVFGSLIHSVSRNPSLSKQLFGYAILGFALSEAMALFALMVAFFILFSDGVHPLPSSAHWPVEWHPVWCSALPWLVRVCWHGR